MRSRPGRLFLSLMLASAVAFGATGIAIVVHVRAWAFRTAALAEESVVAARARLLDSEIQRLARELERLAQLPEFARAGESLAGKKRVLQIARKDFAIFSMRIALVERDGGTAWVEPPGELPGRAAELLGAAREAPPEAPVFRYGNRLIAAGVRTPGGEVIAGFIEPDAPHLLGEALLRAAGEEGRAELLYVEPAGARLTVAASGTGPPGLAPALDGAGWRTAGDGAVWLVTESAVGDGPLRLRLVESRARLRSAFAAPLDRLVAILAAAIVLAVLGGGVVAATLARLERARLELARAQDLAALGKSAAGIAHEVKNSLNGLSVALDLLAARRADPATNDAVHAQAREEIRRLQDVADGLDLFASAPRLDLAPVDLYEVSRRAAATLGALAAELDAELELVPPPRDGPVIVRGDDRKLRSALQNVIRNGLEALGSGAGGAGAQDRRLVLRTGAEAGWGWVEVGDRGPGIPAELRGRLFEPFASTKRNGTGLGLAIVSRVVEAHGGRLEVLDREGGGTIFRMEFPLWMVRAAADAASGGRAP